MGNYTIQYDRGDPKVLRDRMQGRTFSVTAEQLSKRSLQARLSQAPGVVDAVIQGEQVRLVMDTATLPSVDVLLPGIQNAQLSEVPPRYEDSFIALLKGQPNPDSPDSPAFSSYSPAAQPAASSPRRTYTRRVIG